MKVRFTFHREDGKMAHADIPEEEVEAKTNTWGYLQVGMFVKGLTLLPTGEINPKCNPIVIPADRIAPVEVALDAPFYGAGTFFNWGLDDKWGFGINEGIYHNAEKLLITAGKYGVYKVDISAVEQFRKTHRTEKMAKGTNLVVIPRALCQKINIQTES